MIKVTMGGVSFELAEKTAIKELPETMTQLKSAYDLVNQYNVEESKGDEK